MPRVSTSSNEPDPEDALRTLASHVGMEFVQKLPVPNTAAIAALPGDMARRYNVAPIELEEMSGSATLRLATSAPCDFDSIDSLSALLQRDLEFVAAPGDEIKRVIAQVYPPNN